ncbi:MAG: ribbon-helix-helix protein, CopG family [Thiohalorhabdus sp.]
MRAIKITAKVDEEVWADLEALAEETGRSLSSLLTEAIGDYVRKHRNRPEVLDHLEASMHEHHVLGLKLAE